jgi:imidazolonepropionase-like amidohydrolase
MKKIIYILLLMSMSSEMLAQSLKAKTGVFALTHATIETITQGTVVDGTLVITNGKIAAVGTNITIPSGAVVIDCKGLRIYPGMMDGGTRIGLLEIGQIPQATDQRETGDVIPQMKALSAVNPNSVVIPVTRVSGVTTVITAPDGGLFPGQAALINLHGYTPDQMFTGFEAVVLNFPSSGKRGFFDRRTDEEVKRDSEKALKLLNDVWDKATQYHKLDSATRGKGVSYYPELQSLVPVVRGEKALMVEVNAAKDIQAALKWVSERKIKSVIFSGVSEGWRVASDIVKANIPVVTGPVISIPTRDYDRYDQAYANAGMMKKAGVKVALRTLQTENVRNLPYHAGYASAYGGMSKEDALRAITIVPAEIFGVSKQLGSLEVGKSATLFVCDGDPFETRTQVKHVFIDGWQIPMTSRQTELYEEFLNREPGVSKN